MGREEFPAVPVLVDRRAEIDRIRSVLDGAGTAESPLLLIRGEAGTGKTRLIQEAMTEAERRGRLVVFGTARAESTAPYHVWAAPLRQLGIDHVLEDAPPPRLMGLYLLDVKGHPLVRVERELERKPGSEASATTFEPDPSRLGKSILGGGLSAFDRGGRRLLVLKHPEVRLCAEVEGHEDEIFVEDLRKLLVPVESAVTGEVVRTTQSFKDLLSSGKYEGIDYAKGDPKLRQSRLFQNAALGLVRNAEVHPLLIVLDDLQWADPSSLALLGYVARSLMRSNALLLGTYRVEEGAVRPHLQQALDRMAREDLFTELRVEGLSRSDMRPLAESFIGPHGLPEPFLDLLWNETAGNPLIVREVLRGLEEDLAVQMHGASKKLVASLAELSIPHRVREAVRARLERVPKEDRRLLEAAAACGTRFTAAMVARLVGQPEGTVLNGFGSIAGVHGFLRGGESDFGFDHPAVQEVLYEDMGEDVRRSYHREAADWLELAGGPIEDVAEHLFRARDIRAAGRLRQAAEASRERYSNEEAIRFYTEALVVEENPEARREILESLGSTQELLGNFRAALAFLADALALAKTGRERARISARTGNIHIKLGDFETATRVCLSALPSVEGEGGTEEAQILHAMGTVHRKKGDYEPSLEYYRRSLALSEKIADRNGVARSLGAIGAVHYDLGDFERALEYLGRSLAISEKGAEGASLAAPLNNIGSVLCRKGDYDRALEYLGRSLAISEKTGDQNGVAVTLHNLGTTHQGRADYERALECFERSLKILEKIGYQEMLANSLANMGGVHFQRGDYDRALEYLGRSLAISEKIGYQKAAATALNFIGSVFRDMGDYPRALDRLGRSLAIQEKIGDRSAAADTLVELAKLALDDGDLSNAESYSKRALSLSTEVGDEATISIANRAFGILYRKQQAWQESSASFEKSLQILARLGQPFQEARTLYEFGLMWKDKGQFDKAREHLTKASIVFQRIGSKRELQKTTAALRDLH